MRRFEDLKLLIASAEKDAVKFYQKGNKAAGVRLRKALLMGKSLSTEIREDVLNRRKAG